MERADRDRIIERFNERLDRFPGDDAAILAVGREGRHQMALDCVIDVGIEPGSSVLDVGCGLGHLLSRLDERGIACRYTGYDINPRLVEEARRRRPDATFEVRDILEEDFGRFDYIVSSTAFNVALEHGDNYALAERALEVAFAHAERGVAIDFATSYVDFQQPGVFYYQPERLFAFAKRLTKRVTLRHDLPLFQFCLYLYPDFSGWR